MYSTARPQASYKRSLGVLAAVKDLGPSIVTKSGLMVGLRERHEEVGCVNQDLSAAACDILTVGHYLRPSESQSLVARYVHPSKFAEYGRRRGEAGSKTVCSSPLARSSFNADETARLALDYSPWIREAVSH